MNLNNLFPYQDTFIEHCRNVQHLSEYSIGMTNSAVGKFWKYYSIKSPTNTNIKEVNSSDIREYLVQLDQKEHLSKKTINKYLSYLKKYFIFLTEHHLINSYPLFDLKGISFQRRETIIINWMSYVSQFISSDIHPETIKLLTVISLGYDLDQLLNVIWLDISDKLNDSELKKFMFDNLTFDKTPNPYIFQGKKVAHFSSLTRITSKTKLDQHLFKFPINPRKLRQSYILSIISNQSLSDEQLLKKLNISQKSLGYYKFCANYYHLVPYELHWH